jgi:protein-tyrosine phosphatase
MKIIKENFKDYKRRNWYWGRVYFISDNREHKARVLWGATLEFVQNDIEKEAIDKKDVERFVNRVVNKWKEQKNAVYFPNPHFDAYASDPKELDELLSFLRENDKV